MNEIGVGGEDKRYQKGIGEEQERNRRETRMIGYDLPPPPLP